VSGRVNRTKERMYWRTACRSSAGSTFFQAGMAVRGFPWAMVRSSSCIRFGRGRRRDEIARSRREKRGLDAVALAGCAMALYAMLAIDGLAVVEIFGGLGEQDARCTAGQ
jgi:hypothetical protein